MAVVAVIFLGGLFVALIAATFEVTFQPPQAWERIGRKRINWLMMLWFGWVLPVVRIPALFAYAFGPRRQVRAVLRADPGVRREPMSMRQVVAHVVEVTGPQGHFVLRSTPRGVSTRAYLFQGWLWARVLRALRRDQAWVLTVRPFSDDPLGKPVYRETVAGIAEVGPGMERVEQAIRAGRVPVPTLGFRSDHPTATPR